MSTLHEALLAWLDTAQVNVDKGGISIDDLNRLRQLLQAAQPRQRLLYLHTRTPSIYGSVIGMAQHEPVADQQDTLRTRDQWPYNTVHDAMVDGWQVVHFPNLMAPYDDREVSYVGYEFILQKMEVHIDGDFD